MSRASPEHALAVALQQDPRFAAAVLFGSVARGTARRDSDVDIAYLARDIDARRAIDRDLFDLLGSFGSIARRDVHLIDLATAPLPLRRGVFDHGRTLFDRSAGALRDLHRATAVEYVDNAYLRRIVDNGLSKRLEALDGRR